MAQAREESATVEELQRAGEQRVAELEADNAVADRHLSSYRAEVEALKVQVHELNAAALRHEEEEKQRSSQPAPAPEATASPAAPPAPPAEAESADDGWTDWGDDDMAVDDSAELIPTHSVKLKAAASSATSTLPSSSSSSSDLPVRVKELELRVRELEEEAEGARADATVVYETLKTAEAEVERLKGLKQGSPSSDEEVEELRARIAEMEEEMRSLLMTSDEDKETLETEVAGYRQRQTEAMALLVEGGGEEGDDLIKGVGALLAKVQSLNAEKEGLRAEREKEEDSEREQLRSQVREWKEKYDGVLRVQAAMQHDGEETERENRALAAEVFDLKDLIGQMEEEKEKTTQQLLLLQQQPPPQPPIQPASTAAEEEVTQPSTSVPAPPAQQEAGPEAQAEPAAEAVESTSAAASPAEMNGVVPAPPAAGAVYTEAEYRALEEQRAKEREELIAYYTAYLTHQHSQLEDLNTRLLTAEARQLQYPRPTLDVTAIVHSSIIASAEVDSDLLPHSTHPADATSLSAVASDEKGGEAEQAAAVDSNGAMEEVVGVEPPFPAELTVQSTPPSSSFALTADAARSIDADGDGVAFTLQPIPPTSPTHPPSSTPSDPSQPTSSSDPSPQPSTSDPNPPFLSTPFRPHPHRPLPHSPRPCSVDGRCTGARRSDPRYAHRPRRLE